MSFLDIVLLFIPIRLFSLIASKRVRMKLVLFSSYIRTCKNETYSYHIDICFQSNALLTYSFIRFQVAEIVFHYDQDCVLTMYRHNAATYIQNSHIIKTGMINITISSLFLISCFRVKHNRLNV